MSVTDFLKSNYKNFLQKQNMQYIDTIVNTLCVKKQQYMY